MEESRYLLPPNNIPIYASLFYSSNISQNLVTIKYLCKFFFFLFLSYKLRGIKIVWFIIFLPILFSSTLSLILKFYELFLMFSVTNRYKLLLCQFSNMIDIFFSLVTKITLCFYLFMIEKQTSIFKSKNIKLSFILSPLWIGIIISSSLKLYFLIYGSNYSLEINRSRYITILSLVFSITVKLIQPLIISLYLDNFIPWEVHWSLLFLPSWLIVFFGLGCSVLLISFSPFLYSISHSMLRDSMLSFLYIISLLLSIISITSMVFLIMVSEKLDYLTGMSAKNISIIKVMNPLLILFGILTVLNPIFSAISKKYQSRLSFLLFQRYERPYNHSLSSIYQNEQRKILFKTLDVPVWFIKKKTSTFEIIDKKELFQHPPNTKNYPIECRNEESINILPKYSEVELTEKFGYLDENPISNTPFHSPLDHSSPLLQVEKVCKSLNNLDVSFSLKVTNDKAKLEHERFSCSKDSSSFIDIEGGKGSSLENIMANECVICLTRSSNCIIMNCGHLITCFDCSLVLLKQDPSVCPICRGKIMNVYKLEDQQVLDGEKGIALSTLALVSDFTTQQGYLVSISTNQLGRYQDEVPYFNNHGILNDSLTTSDFVPVSYNDTLMDVLS